MDGDGNKDVLITGDNNNSDPTATLYLGHGDGTFSEAGADLIGVFNGSTSIADIDNDGNKDVLIAGGGSTTLYLGNGDGSFSEAGAGLDGFDLGSTSVGDINNDGDKDLLLTGRHGSFPNRDPTTTLYLGNGDGSFSKASAGLVGVSWSSTSIADVDNDGSQDLLITGNTTDGTVGADPTVKLYLGNGDGTFSEAAAELTGVWGSSTSIGDIDGDENQDLLITGRDAEDNPTATLYLGAGDGTFSKADAGLTGVINGSTSIVDIYGDGDEDLLITGGEGRAFRFR